jgi:serine/threonine protein kinase
MDMEPNKIFEEFKIYKKLHEDKEADTFLVAYKDRDNELLVLKTPLPQLCQNKPFLIEYKQKAKLHSQLKHKNIVTFFDVIGTDDSCSVLMEYVEGVNLDSLVRKVKETKTKLSKQLFYFILRCICGALYYSRTKAKLEHGGLNFKDIIISYEGNIKLKGFGFYEVLEKFDVIEPTFSLSGVARDVWLYTQLMLGLTQELNVSRFPKELKQITEQVLKSEAKQLSKGGSSILMKYKKALKKRVKKTAAKSLSQLMKKLFAEEYESGILRDKNMSLLLPAKSSKAVARPKEKTKYEDDFDNQVATVLTDFEILEKLSSSKFARIYKVLNKRTGATRILKILQPWHRDNPEIVEMFVREAKIAANLDHENIVTVYSVGQRKEINYIEMEYIEGYTLDKLANKYGQIPLPILLFIIYEVCRALSYAHEEIIFYRGKEYHGVVHRDVKPSNIMVTSRGTVKLTDFGLAIPVDIAKETGSEPLIGTINFMSPEQLHRRAADNKADIYALGVTLYLFATGQKPFAGRTITEVIEQIKLGKFRRPKEVNRYIPIEIDNIISKAMSSYENRYNSILELQNDIKAFLQKRYVFRYPQQELIKYLKYKNYYPSKFFVRKKKSKKLVIFLAVGIPLIVVAGVSLILVYNPGIFKGFVGLIKYWFWLLRTLPQILGR